MLYRIDSSHEFDSVLEKYTGEIIKFCDASEFQHLPREALQWDIPADAHFVFRYFYLIENVIPLCENTVCDEIVSFEDSDGVLMIPVALRYRGEEHFYHIALPPRINCLDIQGRINSDNVGRYLMFKSQRRSDKSVYITDSLRIKLQRFPMLNIKGVE